MARYWKWFALLGCAAVIEFLPGPTLSEEFWRASVLFKAGSAVFAIALLGHLFFGWLKKISPETWRKFFALAFVAAALGVWACAPKHLPDPPEWHDPACPGCVEVPPTPPAPERATGAALLDYKGCLGTLRDTAGRVVWTPALPGAPTEVRQDWYARLRAAGCTHVPIGPFGPGPSYPGIVAWDNPDWRNDPAAIRGLVEELLSTPSADGLGFRPIIFTDGGPRNPKPRLQAFFPVLKDALEGLDDYVIVVPAGWEPVVGDFTSNEVSWALETWHAYRPRSLIGYHGSPTRLVGSSNCTPEKPDDPTCTPNDRNDLRQGGYEPDDPWRGGESTFYTSHGGQYISIALYQTPHGDALYRPCDPDNEDGSCWANRWQDYVSRIGTGFHGWRALKLVLFEVGTFETTHGRRPVADTLPVVRLGAQVCAKWNAPCGYGDGLPTN